MRKIIIASLLLCTHLPVHAYPGENISIEQLNQKLRHLAVLNKANPDYLRIKSNNAITRKNIEETLERIEKIQRAWDRLKVK